MEQNFNGATILAECEDYLPGPSAFTDLPKVADLTKAYRSQPGITHAKGFLFDIEAFETLMAQNGGNINGIRIYMGLDASGVTSAIAVATLDGDDFDIPMAKTEATNAILVEGRPCPSQCGRDNALNKP